MSPSVLALLPWLVFVCASCSGPSRASTQTVATTSVPPPHAGQGRASQVSSPAPPCRISPVFLLSPKLPRPPNDPHDEHPCRSSAVHGRRSTAPLFPIAGTSSDPSKHQNRTLGEQGPLPHPFPAKSGRLPPSIPPSAMHSSAQGPHCFFSVLSREFSINQGPLCDFV
jgi:hypothetical protein